MRERWQSIPALTSRESTGQVIYPPEFWQVNEPKPDRVARFIARNGTTLTRIAAWAAFLGICYGWAWLLAMGGRW